MLKSQELQRVAEAFSFTPSQLCVVVAPVPGAREECNPHGPLLVKFHQLRACALSRADTGLLSKNSLAVLASTKASLWGHQRVGFEWTVPAHSICKSKF